MKLKRYKKEFEHSYAFGVFPTLELLLNRPELVTTVIAHPKGEVNKGVFKIQENCEYHGIPYEVQEKLIQRLGGRDNDYAVGVFRKAEITLDETSDHIILVNPSGMGNLGTIIRTMLGFGFQDLAIIQPAADVYHPDVIRASMGAIFKLRVQRFASFDDYNNKYMRNFYALITDGDVNLPEVRFCTPYSLIFGNESSGLPDEFKKIGTNVKIQQSKKIDSLNLAVSVGITLYGAIQNAR